MKQNEYLIRELKADEEGELDTFYMRLSLFLKVLKLRQEA